MAQLPMPDVPPGNLRGLIKELHSLHAQAGWPSTRDMERDAKALLKGRPASRIRPFSHTAIHDLFTKTTARAPRRPVLITVVEVLAGIAPRTEVHRTLDKFDELWRAAAEAPLITEFIEEMGYTSTGERSDTAAEPESAGPPAAATSHRDPATLPPLEVKLLELVADGQPWEEIATEWLGDKRVAHYRMNLAVERLNADSPETAAYIAWQRGQIRVRPVGVDDNDDPSDDPRWGAKEYLVLASDRQTALDHAKALERRTFQLTGPPTRQSTYWVAKLRGTGDTIVDGNYLGGYVSTHHGARFGDVADFRETVPPNDEYATRPELSEPELDALWFLSANRAMLTKSPVMHQLSAAGVADAIMSLYAKLGVGNPAAVLNRAIALGFVEPPETETPSALTENERAILELVGEGKLIEQIAKELNISRATATYRLTKLEEKFAANNRIQLVAKAYKLGVLDPGQQVARPGSVEAELLAQIAGGKRSGGRLDDNWSGGRRLIVG